MLVLIVNAKGQPFVRSRLPGGYAVKALRAVADNLERDVRAAEIPEGDDHSGGGDGSRPS